jgi:hypothetical protein
MLFLRELYMYRDPPAPRMRSRSMIVNPLTRGLLAYLQDRRSARRARAAVSGACANTRPAYVNSKPCSPDEQSVLRADTQLACACAR